MTMLDRKDAQLGDVGSPRKRKRSKPEETKHADDAVTHQAKRTKHESSVASVASEEEVEKAQILVNMHFLFAVMQLHASQSDVALAPIKENFLISAKKLYCLQQGKSLQHAADLTDAALTEFSLFKNLFLNQDVSEEKINQIFDIAKLNPFDEAALSEFLRANSGSEDKPESNKDRPPSISIHDRDHNASMGMQEDNTPDSAGSTPSTGSSIAEVGVFGARGGHSRSHSDGDVSLVADHSSSADETGSFGCSNGD